MNSMRVLRMKLQTKGNSITVEWFWLKFGKRRRCEALRLNSGAREFPFIIPLILVILTIFRCPLLVAHPLIYTKPQSDYLFYRYSSLRQLMYRNRKTAINWRQTAERHDNNWNFITEIIKIWFVLWSNKRVYEWVIFGVYKKHASFYCLFTHLMFHNWVIFEDQWKKDCIISTLQFSHNLHYICLLCYYICSIYYYTFFQF